MDCSDKVLEEKLRVAGEKLALLPTQVDVLLPLLDEVENLLAKVEQSPSQSIQDSYYQSMKALLAEPLLRHTDGDVQVAVASCISEITRITAPEAPYTDDQMKEVFQLIVSSFVDLSDMSSRSYDKRASILETVAKVRSCVVMLDLECEGLISEMFQHFLSSIRDEHPEKILTSMETIMTLVLEESEDVSLDLLTPILASVKRNSEEIPTAARKLGERVFEKCAVKLKPYLKQAVKSLGFPMDSYSEIVATVCNGSNGEVEHKDGNISSLEQLYDDLAELEWLSNFVEKSFSTEDLQIRLMPTPRLISTGTNASGNHQFQTENNGNNPVSPPVGFPRKARSKRSRRVRFRSTAHPWTCQVEEFNINQSAIQPLSTMLEGERLGQALSVEVINSSTHNEYESFRIGQPESSPPHEGLENEGDTSQQLGCIFKLLFEDGTEQDQHVLQMDKSDSTINSNEETVTREMSKRTPDNAAEIIHLDESEDETPVKYIEPQSLTTQPKRSKQILEDEGNTVEIEHLALEMTSEDATKDKEHITAAERDVLVEESPVEDVGYAMTTSSQPSTFQTMKSVTQQEVEDVLQKLMLEDVLQKQNEGIIEEVDTTIHFVSETCIEDTSEREKKSEKDISFESLREHFGRSLDDAANSFGVSRSTFKRICRGHGIKRWQYGKRMMDGKISSSLRRRLNDEEPSTKSFSCSAIPPVQDTVPHTSQDLNKMTVKAKYNGVTIRFGLHGSSGIAELQDHVMERLHLERDSFSIKYQDDEGDWVLIACDKDVQECMEISRSSNKTIIKMLLDPPINHYVI